MSSLCEACLYRGDRSLSMFSLLFLLCIVIGPGIIHSSLGIFPFFQRRYDDGNVNMAALMLFTFTLVYCTSIQYFYFGYQKNLKNVKIKDKFPNKFSSFPAILAFSILFLISISWTGLGVFTTTRANQTFERDPIQNIVEIGARYCAFFIFWLTFYDFKKIKTFFRFLIFVLSFIIFYFGNNPASLPRSITIAYIVIFIITFLPLGRPIYKIYISLCYFLGLNLLMPILNQISRGKPGENIFSQVDKYYFESLDLDSFQSIINIYNWVSDSGIKWGRQIFTAIFVFVPRSVWHSKSHATGELAAGFARYEYTNVSAPLPAELYSDFGWLGLVLGAMALGAFTAKVDQSIDFYRKQQNIIAILPYATLVGFCGIVIRGSLIGVGAFVAYAVLFAILTQHIAAPNTQTIRHKI